MDKKIYIDKEELLQNEVFQNFITATKELCNELMIKEIKIENIIETTKLYDSLSGELYDTIITDESINISLKQGDDNLTFELSGIEIEKD